MPLPQMQVIKSGDRPPLEQQIEEILQRAREQGKPARVRIPLTLYDYGEAGQDGTYINLRAASWNLTFPIELCNAAMVQELIDTVGACIVAVGTKGSEAVVSKLGELG